mmetsp:Transcript_14588/g.32156  ORF Transcript_14588/g.32156 Transcript_14588/m.32156 type:complete len:213 (+) Transcript_14588:230-868(+)
MSHIIIIGLKLHGCLPNGAESTTSCFCLLIRTPSRAADGHPYLRLQNVSISPGQTVARQNNEADVRLLRRNARIKETRRLEHIPTSAVDCEEALIKNERLVYGQVVECNHLNSSCPECSNIGRIGCAELDTLGISTEQVLGGERRLSLMCGRGDHCPQIVLVHHSNLSLSPRVILQKVLYLRLLSRHSNDAVEAGHTGDLTLHNDSTAGLCG